MLTRSAREFLVHAGDYLAHDSVVSTVVSTFAKRVFADEADGLKPPAEDWWLVVRDGGGEVVGAGMRTAPFQPRPAYLLPMPDEAAESLARLLHERDEPLLAVSGAMSSARRCAEETARLIGGRVEVARHTRLHELGRLEAPRPVAGRLRRATPSELDVVRAWFAAFARDGDEQAGREPGARPDETPADDELVRRIDGDRVWLWEDGAGQVVHMTGTNPPASGVARIGPVYTPPAERGRGWAGAAVAEVSARLQAAGCRVCLFTDQQNPVSNALYERLGFRPVVDMVELQILLD